MSEKIHIGCGPVYLDGYTNIDAEVPGVHFLAGERPDLVEQNRTDLDNYYKYDVTRQDIEQRTLNYKGVVVDKFANAFDLPYMPESLEEIRAVQVFEHFTYREGEDLLNYWIGLLQPGGKLHLDIPDLDGTIQGYLQAQSTEDKDWYLRLLFGSQKNEYGFHKGMYSQEKIARLFDKVGLVDIGFGQNIHFYPAFSIEGTKPFIIES